MAQIKGVKTVWEGTREVWFEIAKYMEYGGELGVHIMTEKIWA